MWGRTDGHLEELGRGQVSSQKVSEAEAAPQAWGSSQAGTPSLTAATAAEAGGRLGFSYAWCLGHDPMLSPASSALITGTTWPV